MQVSQLIGHSEIMQQLEMTGEFTLMIKHILREATPGEATAMVLLIGEILSSQLI